MLIKHADAATFQNKLQFNFLSIGLKSPVHTNQTGGYSPVRAIATGPVNPVLTGLKFN